jgi:hypothetical protein
MWCVCVRGGVEWGEKRSASIDHNSSHSARSMLEKPPAWGGGGETGREREEKGTRVQLAGCILVTYSTWTSYSTLMLSESAV